MDNRTRFAWALSLSRGRTPEARTLFFIEGAKAVMEAAASSLSIRHAFVDRTALASVAFARDALRARRVPITEITPRDLVRISHTRTPQGVVVIAERPPARGPVTARERALAVYLDGVQDPGNVGAVVRAARSLGATHVVWGPGAADPFGPRAARAAAGAELCIPIVADAEGRLPGDLRAAGFHVVAAVAHGGAALAARPQAPKIALLLGSEGTGVSPKLLSLAHARISIPLAEGAESLNVAQAAAVILYAWRGATRVRRAPPGRVA